MLVRIVKRTFSGAEYCPEQKVLKLGGEGSTGVETLEFDLPEEWDSMAVTVHVQQLDGTLPQPVMLGEDRCIAVDRMFTASEKGLWMLRAMDGNGYCAMTRPARYECYETFATDGDTEITPSQYEAFVAQVLGAANTASQKAKDAQSAADRAENAVGEAQKAKAAAADSAQQAKDEAESAQTAAQQADKAAARAEGYAPKDGTVLSVNGKGGAVQLNAEDVGAMDADRGDLVQQVVLDGRTLTVVFTDGTQQTYTTQDTTDLTAMTGVLSTANGGTGLDRALKAEDVGAVGKGSGDYLKGVRVQGQSLVMTMGNGKSTTETVLPCATAAVLGGVKAGRGLTVSADGTLEVTAENLDTVLGFRLAEKLKRLERMMDMDGKLVYTGAGVAGKAATSLTVPETADYIVVKMLAPAALESSGDTSTGVGTAADYGSTRIVRGGTAVAMVGGLKYDLRSGVKCSGAAPVRMSFAADGTLNVDAARTDASGDHKYPFNVEGYQYV